MSKLLLRLAVLCLALGGPAVAAPTSDQAAQLKAARDALTALEATLNTVPPPVVPPPVTPPPVPTPSGWGLGTTLNMSAWNRTVSNVKVLPGEVKEFVLDVKSATAALMYGAATPDHSLVGNTSWIGGTAASASLRSDTGAISSGSAVKATPAMTFGVGPVNMKLDRVANAITWRAGVKSYTLAVPTWASAASWSPAVSVENGAAFVGLNATTVSPTPVPDPIPTPTPGPVGAKKSGVVVVNTNSAAAVQDWMIKALGGAKPWGVWGNGDDTSDKALSDSVGGGLSGVYNPVRWALDNGVAVNYTIPILTRNGAGGTATAAVWQAAANGSRDAVWRGVATQIAQAFAGKRSLIIIRPASEPNGNWFYYSIVPGQEQLFGQAFARMAKVFREVGAPLGVDFKMDFNVQLAQDYGVDIWKAYPGDPSVDYVTGDFYYLTKRGHTTDQAAAFAMYNKASCPSLTSCKNVGLNDLAAFANAHGKQIGATEWGVDCDCGAYVKSVGVWFAANGYPANFYWNTSDDPGATTVLTDGSKPNALAAYRAAFAP